MPGNIISKLKIFYINYLIKKCIKKDWVHETINLYRDLVEVNLIITNNLGDLLFEFINDIFSSNIPFQMIIIFILTNIIFNNNNN